MGRLGGAAPARAPRESLYARRAAPSHAHRPRSLVYAAGGRVISVARQDERRELAWRFPAGLPLRAAGASHRAPLHAGAAARPYRDRARGAADVLRRRSVLDASIQGLAARTGKADVDQ